MGIDFTNKIVSEGQLLRCLLHTACMKAAGGIDPSECAEVAAQEVEMGFLIPYIREMESYAPANPGNGGQGGSGCQP